MKTIHTDQISKKPAAPAHTGSAGSISIRRLGTILLCCLLLTAASLSGCAGRAGREESGSTEQAEAGNTERESPGRTGQESDADASAAAAAGASSTASETASAAAAAAAAEDSGKDDREAGPRMLKYIDAWEEWHTMEVDPTVRETAYDAEKFVQSEENPQWVTYAGEYECLQGIDVSEHQGAIDWQAVADAGCRFAFIRVGYRGYGEAGNLLRDSTAVENLQNAKSAGLDVGAYFFSQALNEEEAREEAALAVSVIEEAGVELDLPLMYDPEIIKDDVGRANEITREQASLNTAAFCKAVEELSSCRADIYSNLPWEHNYFDAETLNTYDIWYADYEPQPQTPYHFTWWQYTNEGTVPGVEGVVDLNLWIREK